MKRYEKLPNQYFCEENLKRNLQTLHIAPFDGGVAAFQVLVVQQVNTAKVACVESDGPHSKFWAFRSN